MAARTGFILFALLAIAVHVRADSPPPRIADADVPSRCTKVLLCEGQTANGLCTVNNQSPAQGEIVSIPLAGFWMHTFYADRSTASAYSCGLETFSQDPTDAGGTGWTFSANPLSPSQPVNWFTGNFDRVAVRCSGITGGSVTVVGLHCPVDSGR